MSNLMTTSILREFTVSEVSLALKSVIEERFGKIKVKGEISGLKMADSGHSYFSLKEGGAVLNAICWRHAVTKMKVKLEEGMEVICTGSLSSYPSRSIYQMNIEEVEVAGVGALLKLLEQRKEKLSAEGLFALERKRKLPFLPKTIAVVTSPTGAVINDIIHRIQERFPVHILVWGVLVQGVEAAKQIADAINGLQNLSDDLPQPELIIVARGGGSIEDLWAFNEEIVVRAAASSRIPLISAVGHETDTTLIDYASDKRAPTPTAAAEMAVPVRQDLTNVLNHYYNRELSSVRNIYRNAQNKLAQFLLRMDANRQMLGMLESSVEYQWQRLNFAIKRNLNEVSNSLIKAQATLSADKMLYQHALLSAQAESWSQRLYKSIEQRMVSEGSNLDSYSNLLQSYSPEGVLKRGFAIITKEDKVVNGVKSLSAGKIINITMHDGTVNASVVSSTSSTVKKPPLKATTLEQKSLF